MLVLLIQKNCKLKDHNTEELRLFIFALKASRRSKNDGHVLLVAKLLYSSFLFNFGGFDVTYNSISISMMWLCIRSLFRENFSMFFYLIWFVWGLLVSVCYCSVLLSQECDLVSECLLTPLLQRLYCMFCLFQSFNKCFIVLKEMLGHLPQF